MAARPIAIDLFAGAGGMSLGFEQAGFDIVAAVEIDPVHCAVHKFNFPRCAVIPKSVVGLSGNEIRVAAGIGKRQVDVVIGGAPCQGFSMIGQRALDDPRNSLVKDFLRIVAELGATYFVFENVKGLTLGSHRKFLEEIVDAAKKHGYQVRSPWRVLNAAHFGVPQHRERLFLYGTKAGQELPEYPLEWTRSADGRCNSNVDANLPHGPTVADALNDLPDADRFGELLSTDEIHLKRWKLPSPYARELRCLTNDAWHFGHVRQWQPLLLTSSARTVHTEISRRRFADTKEGETEPVSRFYRLAADGLSNTLRAGTDGARGAFTSPRPIHYKFPRCVTVREMARLHGYPDWFRFNETKWHGARQIGNSVPPPLARAVARSVIRTMDVNISRSCGVLELGMTELLRFAGTEAAAHFGIVSLPSKRDRKSGATKRKQWEIEALRIAAR